MSVTINGSLQQIEAGERLIDVINRSGARIPQVCYHPQLGPIQTCDTCMVEVDGKLVRACGTAAADGMNVVTSSPRADAAQREAFDRILGNHCSTARSATTTTATAPCTTPPTARASSTRRFPTSPSRMKWTCRIPSTATIPTSASSAGAAWRPARTCK